MDTKKIGMAIAFGMVGAYALGILSRKFGPFPGLKAS